MVSSQSFSLCCDLELAGTKANTIITHAKKTAAINVSNQAPHEAHQTSKVQTTQNHSCDVIRSTADGIRNQLASN
jgi:hypothetical protein